MAATGNDFPLATDTASNGNGVSDGSALDSSGVNSAAGASGSSSAMELSQGAIVAIVIIVVLVALVGIATGALFLVAKRREWTIKETLRRSTKKVVTALTPRRSEFPKHLKDPSGSNHRSASARGRARVDDVPPTPRLPKDLEKGYKGSVAAVRVSPDRAQKAGSRGSGRWPLR